MGLAREGENHAALTARINGMAKTEPASRGGMV